MVGGPKRPRPCGLCPGSITFALAGTLATLAYLPGKQGNRPGTGRKAALLGIAAAVGFGFVAAVVKEFDTRLSAGAPSCLLELVPLRPPALWCCRNVPGLQCLSGRFASRLPAGINHVDPLVAGALGVVLFGESLRHNPLVLSGEVLAVALVIASVIMLSQSPLSASTRRPAGGHVRSTGACSEGPAR